MPSDNNKRIAKNTVYLYFRMLLIMPVSFYTSRVVLAELGVDDYGIYNVVGGVVMFFSFLKGCMSATTQRFLTFDMGEGDCKKLNHTFSTALNIHIGIAIIIILLGETVGLWFINNTLNIPATRMYAANWVYQFSIITFCINIIQVPYNAALIAHEKMDIYAYISIIEVLMKLGIAYILTIISSDKLIIYGLLLLIIQIILNGIYQLYCRVQYPECRFRITKNPAQYKQIAGFASWNLAGNLTWIIKDQGSNIILNIFFGPAINAARALAIQVSGVVIGFASNFQVALNPQITKQYALKDIETMKTLVMQGVKYSFILIFILTFPLLLNIDYVLNLWLTKVPQYTSYFIILIMVEILISTLFGTPYTTAITATGKNKYYEITLGIINLLTFAVAYILLRSGYAAVSVFYVSIAFTFISGLARILIARHQIGFSLNQIAEEVLAPIGYMLLLAVPIPLFLRLYYFPDINFGSFILLCAITTLFVLLATWKVVLKKNEKESLLQVVKNKLRRS